MIVKFNAGGRTAASDSPGNEATRRVAVPALALPVLLVSIGTSIANVALPTFVRVFTASYQEVQWIVLAYLLAVTTLVVNAGRLGDAVGRRRLLLFGIVVFTAASAACAAVSSLPALVFARAVQGAGAAVITALSMALVGDVVPRERVGAAMGVLGTMSAVGTALGPGLGGLLIDAGGWRSIFLLNAPLGVLAFILVWRTLPAGDAKRARPEIDGWGTLMLLLTLTAYALAMTSGRGRLDLNNAALLLAAAGGLVLFVHAERRASAPLIRIELFKRNILSAGFAMNVLVTSVVMATLVVGPFYLAGALALGPGAVGLVMAIGPVVSALTGIPAGRLVDHAGAARVTIVALLGMAAGTAALPLLAGAAGVAGYAAPLALITAGYAMFQAANNTAVMRSVTAEERGVVSGILNLSRNLGLITGASAMGAVYTAAAGLLNGPAAPRAAVAGMRATFGVATCLVGIALSIAVWLVYGRENRADEAFAMAGVEGAGR